MYRVNVKDADGNMVEVEVTKEVFEVLDEQRKEAENLRNEYRRHFTVADVELLGGDNIENIVIWEDCFDRIYHVIENCTTKQRQRFMLYLQGYSYRKIAKRLGCSLGSVRQSIKQVKDKIINIL